MIIYVYGCFCYNILVKYQRMRYSVTSLTPKNPEDIFTAFIEVNDENKLEAYHNNLCGFDINRCTVFHLHTAG